jgi:hypothetical protein
MTSYELQSAAWCTRTEREARLGFERASFAMKALPPVSTCFAGHDVEVSMARYGKSASKNVESAMRRRKKGTLKSGSGRTVRSRKQAIAIGLSEAREKGAKVPARRKS